MKKKSKSVIIAGLIIVSFLFVTQPSIADAETVLQMEDLSIVDGESDTGCVRVLNAVDVGSLDFILSWNPDVVSLVSVDDSTCSFDSVFYSVNESNGVLSCNAYDIDGLSDDLIVVCLTFEAADDATSGDSCNLVFSDYGLYDASPQGYDIDVIVDDGSVLVEGDVPPGDEDVMLGVEDVVVPLSGNASGCVSVLNAVDVGSVEFTLSWNSDVVSLVSIDDTVSSFDSVIPIGEEVGSLSLMAYSENENGLSDDLIVVCLTFEAADDATSGDSCNLVFSDYGLYDASPQGYDIDVIVDDGSVLVEGDVPPGDEDVMLGVEDVVVPLSGNASGCVSVLNAVDVGSVEFTLSWNSDVVSLVSIDDTVSSFDSVIPIGEEVGSLSLMAYSENENGLSGNLTIICITFERTDHTTDGGESCNLLLSNTGIFDSTTYGNNIEHFIDNGVLTVEEKQEPSPPPSGGGGGGGSSTSSTSTSTGTVNRKPTAKFTIDPTTAFIGETITFNASDSNDPDKDELQYTWDFGDGETSTNKITTHSYDTGEIFTVKLTVDDGKGGTDSETTTIDIKTPNSPPSKPTLTGPSTGTKNNEYTFEIQSTDADNDTIMYVVNWGDKEEENTSFMPQGDSVSVKHSWKDPGKYRVTVYSTDGKTTSATTEKTVLIDILTIAGIGYLVDEDGDGIYECCFIDNLGETTDVEHSTDDTYLIDENNDGTWDFSYSLSSGILSSLDQNNKKTEESSMDLQMILLLVGAIIIIGVILIAYYMNRQKRHVH